MKNNQNYKMCSLSVMDNSGDPDISFDEKDICNYYYEYFEKSKLRTIPYNEKDERLAEIIEKIKEGGKNKQYDCIIGISGGVDSSYTAYLVKKLGLRPMAVHFDNGWDSELAVSNIKKILNKLEIDLYTYVIDWEEFKDIQLSFLKASTPDGEVPTDHAILAVLYKIANENKIKYIVSGNNFRTEGIMPPSWAYGHIDWKYIKSVHKKFGKVKFKSFPYITLPKYLYYTFVKGIKMVSILNYINYDKVKAQKILEDELGWQYYGGKHYESIYTRFYQSYILPNKFNIDKRKIHLSTLIFAGLLSKEEALEEMSKPAYPEEKLKFEKEYVINKFGISEKEFDEIMSAPVKNFRDYPNSNGIHQRYKNVLNFLRKKKILYN
jgi:N-acetyl sugar amidotransferase